MARKGTRRPANGLIASSTSPLPLRPVLVELGRLGLDRRQLRVTGLGPASGTCEGLAVFEERTDGRALAEPLWSGGAYGRAGMAISAVLGALVGPLIAAGGDVGSLWHAHGLYALLGSSLGAAVGFLPVGLPLGGILENGKVEDRRARYAACLAEGGWVLTVRGEVQALDRVEMYLRGLGAVLVDRFHDPAVVAPAPRSAARPADPVIATLTG